MLEYFICFQNIGIDIVFIVEILNFFLFEFNLSILQFLGSSYDYKLIVLEDNLFSFWFDYILLFDSIINLEVLQGYICYWVEYWEGFLFGIIIENDVVIYFDFNEFIFINIILIIIDENFILVNMEEIYVLGLFLNVYFNFFIDFLNIFFDGLFGNIV